MSGIVQIKRKFGNKTFKVSLQKAIFEHLTASIPHSFAKTFAARFKKALNIGIEHADVSEAPFLPNFSARSNTCCCSLPASSHPQLVLLRTWSNGWFTTHRMRTENDGGWDSHAFLAAKISLIRFPIIFIVTPFGPFCTLWLELTLPICILFQHKSCASLNPAVRTLWDVW